MELKKVVEWLDLCKEDLLKGWQYLTILLAWFQERNNNIPKYDFYFSIYLQIFHSRKLFRLLKTLTYLPKIIELSKQIKEKLIFTSLFDMISKIFTALFYTLDNITIISMKMEFQYYKTIRRISYIILFWGIFFSTVSILIKLRQSFKREGEIKGQLETMTPTELLEALASIDNERKIIAIKLIKAFGHLFPTLARTNLPQIVIKTKINKGTVGFFGMISAFCELYLKTFQIEKE